MCGVAGCIAPKASTEERHELAWRLLLNTQTRGKDSTGIGFYDAHGNPIVVKAPVTADEFVKMDEFDESFIEHDPTAYILHCRARTKGDEKIPANNHPVFSKTTGLMLVHNGRVQDERWRQTFEDGSQPYLYQAFDGEVDTEAALRLIETMRYIPRQQDGSINPEQVAATPKEQWKAEVSWFKAIDDATYNATGSYVLNIMNPEERNTVYFVRHHNPLVVAWVPQFQGIVWASTEDILKKSLTRQVKLHGLFPKNEIMEYYAIEVGENQLLKLSMKDGEPKYEEAALRCGLGNPHAVAVTKAGVSVAE